MSLFALPDANVPNRLIRRATEKDLKNRQIYEVLAHSEGPKGHICQLSKLRKVSKTNTLHQINVDVMSQN